MADDKRWGCGGCGTEYTWDDYPWCVSCKTADYFQWLDE